MPHPAPNPHEPPLTHLAATLRKALKTTRRKPAPKPLHNLRSTLRRIQALLQLLPDPDSTTHFLNATKPIRQSSGPLRDLDIQLDLLTQLPNPTPDTTALTRYLHKKRRQQATKLQRQLQKHHSEFLSLIDQLEPPIPVKPSAQPAKLAQTLFAETTATLNPQIPDQLHAIRKAARISRYIAESSPKGAETATAHHFHHLHQVLGIWHDWLILTETAQKHLPATSPLLPTLQRHQTQAHRAALKLVTQNPAKTPVKPPATKKSPAILHKPNK
jgi:CHAD domain-containing protein